MYWHIDDKLFALAQAIGDAAKVDGMGEVSQQRVQIAGVAVALEAQSLWVAPALRRVAGRRRVRHRNVPLCKRLRIL